MKIIVFAPHQDDEVFAAGGTIIQDLEAGHEVHIVWLTDGRAAYTFNRAIGKLEEVPETQISEDELAALRKEELYSAMKVLGVPETHLHLLGHECGFPDQKLSLFLDAAIEQVKPFVESANRVFLPRTKNTHVDHQAVYDIVTRAAEELALHELEFWVYSLYRRMPPLPKEKRVRVRVSEYRDRKWAALQEYQSQFYIEYVKAFYEGVKNEPYEKFGQFFLADLGQYEIF